MANYQSIFTGSEIDELLQKTKGLDRTAVWHTGTAAMSRIDGTDYYGPVIVEGATFPSRGTVRKGDMYLHTPTSDVYRCHSSSVYGTWEFCANIKGAKGANGANGAAGSSFVSIELHSKDEYENTYLITYSDGKQAFFGAPKGDKGLTGLAYNYVISTSETNISELNNGNSITLELVSSNFNRQPYEGETFRAYIKCNNILYSALGTVSGLLNEGYTVNATISDAIRLTGESGSGGVDASLIRKDSVIKTLYFNTEKSSEDVETILSNLIYNNQLITESMTIDNACSYIYRTDWGVALISSNLSILANKLNELTGSSHTGIGYILSTENGTIVYVSDGNNALIEAMGYSIDKAGWQLDKLDVAKEFGDVNGVNLLSSGLTVTSAVTTCDDIVSASPNKWVRVLTKGDINTTIHPAPGEWIIRSDGSSIDVTDFESGTYEFIVGNDPPNFGQSIIVRFDLSDTFAGNAVDGNLYEEKTYKLGTAFINIEYVEGYGTTYYRYYQVSLYKKHKDPDPDGNVYFYYEIKVNELESTQSDSSGHITSWMFKIAPYAFRKLRD